MSRAARYVLLFGLGSLIVPAVDVWRMLHGRAVFHR